MLWATLHIICLHLAIQTHSYMYYHATMYSVQVLSHWHTHLLLHTLCHIQLLWHGWSLSHSHCCIHVEVLSCRYVQLLSVHTCTFSVMLPHTVVGYVAVTGIGVFIQLISVILLHAVVWFCILTMFSHCASVYAWLLHVSLAVPYVVAGVSHLSIA